MPLRWARRRRRLSDPRHGKLHESKARAPRPNDLVAGIRSRGANNRSAARPQAAASVRATTTLSPPFIRPESWDAWPRLCGRAADLLFAPRLVPATRSFGRGAPCLRLMEFAVSLDPGRRRFISMLLVIPWDCLLKPHSAPISSCRPSASAAINLAAPSPSRYAGVRASLNAFEKSTL